MVLTRSVTISCASVVVGLVATLGGCQQAGVSAATVNPASADAEIAPEGTIDCAILCVSDVVKDAKSHAGRVAVRGVVSKVFPNRRAFTVSNIVEGATCCATGCGHDSIPARVPLDQYAGEMPKESERVIVVGEIVPNGEGFDFVIEEVWTGGTMVLTRRG